MNWSLGQLVVEAKARLVAGRDSPRARPRELAWRLARAPVPELVERYDGGARRHRVAPVRPQDVRPGRNEIEIPGSTLTIGIYSPERCIADAFRLRGDAGYEMGRDALRVASTWRQARTADGDRLATAAHLGPAPANARGACVTGSRGCTARTARVQAIRGEGATKRVDSVRPLLM